MLLNCADEAYRYVGGALLDALSALDLERPVAASPLRIRFGLVDPDCVLYVDADRHELRFADWGDGEDAPLIAMRGDLAVRFCQGVVDVTAAVAIGEVVASGDWREVVGLMSGRDRLAASFEAVVSREGRADLLPTAVAC